MHASQFGAHAVLPLVCAGLFCLSSAARADCSRLSAANDRMSANAKAVETDEAVGQEISAKSSWNAMNHFALEGAQEFKRCDDTMPRLLYSVSFADATAVGMHYGLVPWSEGAGDIAGSLQIIDALPHSATVEKEWELVDRLYRQVCAMHGARCAPRTY